jgi:hypothetical protein
MIILHIVLLYIYTRTQNIHFFLSETTQEWSNCLPPFYARKFGPYALYINRVCTICNRHVINLNRQPNGKWQSIFSAATRHLEIVPKIKNTTFTIFMPLKKIELQHLSHKSFILQKINYVSMKNG